MQTTNNSAVINAIENLLREMAADKAPLVEKRRCEASIAIAGRVIATLRSMTPADQVGAITIVIRDLPKMVDSHFTAMRVCGIESGIDHAVLQLVNALEQWSVE